MTDRLPPHSVEHELKVIGGAIIDRNVMDDESLEIVRHEDFYIERHREIFAAMESLDDRGAPLDAFTVNEELRVRRRLGVIRERISRGDRRRRNSFARNRFSSKGQCVRRASRAGISDSRD